MRGCEGRARARETSVFQEHLEEETMKAERREKNMEATGVETFKDIVFIFILIMYSDFIVMKHRGMWDKTT